MLIDTRQAKMHNVYYDDIGHCTDIIDDLRFRIFIKMRRDWHIFFLRAIVAFLLVYIFRSRLVYVVDDLWHRVREDFMNGPTAHPVNIINARIRRSLRYDGIDSSSR